MFGLSRNAIWAFGVHILTASGGFFAFLSLVATAELNFPEAFFWLGVALFVDGIDGPLARKLEVKKHWPYWSGDILDVVIDYVSYVMIPAFILYQSGLLGAYASFSAAAIIVITSAIYYADTRTKTKDYGFKGFPICWNMVVFTLYVVSPKEILAMVVVLAAAVLTFVPVIFVHPVRVKTLRIPTLLMFSIWSLGGLIALYFKYIIAPIPFWVGVLILLSAAYLFCIGGVLQFLGKLK